MTNNSSATSTYPSDDTVSGRDAERLKKAPNAYRTISEVAEELQIPQHRLRSWETMYPVIKPFRGESGRRYYSPQDIETIRQISDILYVQGYKGQSVMKVLRTRREADRRGYAAEQEEPCSPEMPDADFPSSEEMTSHAEGMSEPALIAEEYVGPDYIVMPDVATSDPDQAASDQVVSCKHAALATPDSSQALELEKLRKDNAYLRAELREILEEINALRNFLPN